MFDAAMHALERINVAMVAGVGLIALLDVDFDPVSAQEDIPMAATRVAVEISIKATNLADATDTVEAGAKYGNMSFESFQAVEDALLAALKGLRQPAQ